MERARGWEQCMCLPADGWITTMWHTHTEEYYPSMKRYEIRYTPEYEQTLMTSLCWHRRSCFSEPPKAEESIDAGSGVGHEGLKGKGNRKLFATTAKLWLQLGKKNGSVKAVRIARYCECE